MLTDDDDDDDNCQQSISTLINCSIIASYAHTAQNWNYSTSYRQLQLFRRNWNKLSPVIAIVASFISDDDRRTTIIRDHVTQGALHLGQFPFLDGVMTSTSVICASFFLSGIRKRSLLISALLMDFMSAGNLSWAINLFLFLQIYSPNFT